MSHFSRILITVLLAQALAINTPQADTDMNDDSFFLSSNNPAATVDQRDMERLAVEISKTDIYQRGRQEAEQMWRAASGSEPSEQDWSLFTNAMDEYAFNYALKAVNGDSNYPKVLSAIYGPAHSWFGQDIPGSRMGGDGPDNHYAFIPIDDQASFRISGRRNTPAPATVIWQFNTNVMFTHSPKTLNASDIDYKDDSRFSVTLGPEAENSRRNYIQIPKGSLFLFIRESRSDWRQVPSALRVERLDPPTAKPRTSDEIANLARLWMVNDVPNAYWFVRIARALPANTMTQPFITGSILGLHMQKISLGNLRIEQDEAFVVTVGSGNAAFRDFVLQDVWYRTIDYPNRLSSMNNAQGVPNADGSTTYVIAHKDPGIHNWLDTGGLVNLSPVHRWQGLPLEDDASDPPSIEGKLVKFDQLEKHLPAEMTKVTAQQRAQQLKERQDLYRLRWVDS